MAELRSCRGDDSGEEDEARGEGDECAGGDEEGLSNDSMSVRLSEYALFILFKSMAYALERRPRDVYRHNGVLEGS